MAYLLREGKGKGVALYSRCESELACQAELLFLLERVTENPRYAGKPVYGFYDVDPSFTMETFLKGYSPDDVCRLVELQERVRADGWRFPPLPSPPGVRRSEKGG